MALAFFDIDNTIVASISAEKLFFFYLLKKGKISLLNYLRIFGFFLKNVFPNPYKATLQNKQYLTGRDINEIVACGKDCFNAVIKKRISPKALEAINWHKKRGDKIILLSGNLYFLADLIKNYVQADDTICTQMQIKNNKFIGKIKGLHPHGKDKKILLHEYIKKNHLENEKIYCYANSSSDIPFLECADKPIAVNASRHLRKYALKHNWPLASFPYQKNKI